MSIEEKPAGSAVIEPEIVLEEIVVPEDVVPEPEPKPEAKPEAKGEEYWKAQAIKNNAIASRLAKKLNLNGSSPKPELPTKENEEVGKRIGTLELAEKKRQFGYEHGLSPEETDSVFRLNPNPTKAVLEDPFVKGGLAALRAKKRISDNTPSSSSRSATIALDPKETPEKKQKALDDFVSKRFAK